MNESLVCVKIFCRTDFIKELTCYQNNTSKNYKNYTVIPHSVLVFLSQVTQNIYPIFALLKSISNDYLISFFVNKNDKDVSPYSARQKEDSISALVYLFILRPF